MRLVGGSLRATTSSFCRGSLLQTADPEWKEGVYTRRGKWMDGWRPGAAVIQATIGVSSPWASRGRIRSVTVDTSHFTGIPVVLAEACGVGTDERLETADWVEIVSRPLRGHDGHIRVEDPHRVTHVRLNIFPDGGVAHLRLDGDPIPGER